VAEELGLSLGEIEIATFPDKENRVRVIDPVLDQDVVIMQSTGVSPNRYYMELFFIIDSLKRSGARSITLVIPYLGYQRQDHIFRDGEGVSLEVIIKILESLGVTRVISLDLHSIKIPQLFKVPVTELSALSLFADKIKSEFDLSEITIVSPDEGGKRRTQKLSEMLGGVATTSINKNRDLNDGNVTAVGLDGSVSKIAIMIDDVISTGATLISGAKLLKESGAQEVIAMATHGIFAADAPNNLQNSGIEKVVVTDSVEIRSNHKFEKLETISISSLISESLS